MALSETETKPWLVKSSGRVIGPYSSLEIENLLRAKELVPLDEVSKSFGRWRYIRDQQEFEVIVNKIKNRQELAGDGNTTDKMDGTDTQNDLLETTEVVHFKKHGSLSEGIDDAIREAVTVKSREAGASTVVYSPSPGNEQTRFPSRAIGFLVAVALGVALGGLWRLRISGKPAESVGFAALVQSAKEHVHLGEYKKARSELEDALRLRPQDEMARAELSVLLIWDNEIAEARKILGLLLKEVEEPVRRAAYLNLLGISEIAMNNLPEAESQLSRALELDETSVAARLNRAFVRLRSDDTESVLSELGNSISPGAELEPMAMLVVGHALLKSRAKGNKGSQNFNQILERYLHALEFYTASRFDFVQELRILQLALLSGNSGLKDREQALDRILDWDPDISRLHIHALNIYDGYSDWNSIRGWIGDLKKLNPKNPGLEVLEALAVYKSESKLEGRRRLEQLRDDLKFGWAAETLLGYYHLALGGHQQAETHFKNVNTKIRRALPNELMGRLCIREGRFSCARESWQAALDIRTDDLMSLAGLAMLAKSENLGGDYLERGLLLSPNFGPLRRAKLNRERGGEEF